MKNRSATFAFLVGIGVVGTAGTARAATVECHTIITPNGGETTECETVERDDPALPSDPTSDSDTPKAGNTLYATTFDLYFNEWITWSNCASDPTGVVWQYYDGNDNPAPGGGVHAMRMHSPGFSSGCAYPGTYALSPASAAYPNVFYKVDAWTRNASNQGATTIIFYDANGHELKVHEFAWTPDAWQFHQQSTMYSQAPPGTVAVRVRYALYSPYQSADIDLVSISHQ
jgi:hypothetical protein